MKKVISYILAVTVIMSVCAFAGCSGKDDGATTGEQDSVSGITTAADNENTTEDESESEKSTAKENEKTTAGKTDTVTAADETLPEGSSTGKLEIVPSAAKVSAGKEFTVTLNLRDCLRLATLDFTLNYDSDKITFVSAEVSSSGGLYSSHSEGEGCVLFCGYVLKTADYANENMMKVTFKVNDNVKSGEKLNFTCTVTEMLIGIDDSGVETVNAHSEISVPDAYVTVK